MELILIFTLIVRRKTQLLRISGNAFYSCIFFTALKYKEICSLVNCIIGRYNNYSSIQLHYFYNINEGKTRNNEDDDSGYFIYIYSDFPVGIDAAEYIAEQYQDDKSKP